MQTHLTCMLLDTRCRALFDFSSFPMGLACAPVLLKTLDVVFLGGCQHGGRLDVRRTSMCGSQGRQKEAPHSLVPYLLLVFVITGSQSR